MWGLGALRDGARGLVKQGAGAVRHGVEAGAKLLENLDENYEDEELEIYDEGSFDSGDSEAEGRRGGAEGSLVGEEEDDNDEPALGGKEAAPSVEGEDLGGSQGDGGYAEVANEAANVAADDASNQQQKLPSEGDLYEALGLDPSSDEFKAVKHEMERLATDHSVELAGKEKHIKKLRREVRRVRQEAEVTVNEMQPQLRKLASMLKASKAEVENLEEQLSSTAEALQEETEGRRADFEALQAQLREERNEGDAEKEGLRQTVQMLQQEMADRNASLSEATKLLEQASARSAESEERTVALAREADELRERLSAVAANGDDRQELGGVAGEPGRGTSESTSLAAAEAALEQERSNVEHLKQELARATCGSVDGETLGERTVELEKRPEETLSQELRDEVEFMKAKLQESETSGEEAMRAAATEAARAAEVREELETAEANLQEMRGRLAEYEEESVRMAELKGTLEITRDALDELRAIASQDAATAERRLKEFQIQLKEACVERDHFRRQAESTAEVAKERLDALEARHEVGLKEATSRAETAEVSVETLRKALVEARERAEALERKAADKATLDQDMERSLEEARGEGRELWARLEQQKTAADEELSAAIESRAEQDALLRTEADNVQELRSELEGRKREIQILQARADAAEAQARALKAPKAGDDSGDGNGDGNDGGIGSGGYGEDEEGSTERGEALDDLEAALRSRYGAEMEEALTGLRRKLGEARKAREVASEELEIERRRVEEMMVTASELEERAGIAGKLEKEIADAAETMKREVAAREAAEVAMRELEKRREAKERAAGAALHEAEQRLEDARADLAATVEEMGRASAEGEAEIGSLKERADATEGELRKLHATLKTKAIEAVAAEEAARVEAVELRRQLDDARQKLAAESESQLAKKIDAAEAVARLEALERDLAAANQALRSTRTSEATAVADAAKALNARALAEDEVSALREEVVASKEEAHALRGRVSGAESAISEMDAARTELEQEVASLREDLAAIEAEHASSQERIRMELEEKWKPRLEEGLGVERARVAKMEREVQALRAKLSKAEEEHTRFSRESASAKEQAALAISEVEGAAQVAAWEVRSLREELKRARERSEKLSSAAEKARESVSASVRTELEGLREAVRVAKAAKEKAEDGLARMKDERKGDLQTSGAGAVVGSVDKELRGENAVEGDAAGGSGSPTASGPLQALVAMLGREDGAAPKSANAVALLGGGGGLLPSDLVHRGLVNTRNTCFRNSVLQALLACEPFVSVLLRAAPGLRHSVPAQGTLPTWVQLARLLAAFEPPKPGSPALLGGSANRKGQRGKGGRGGRSTPVGRARRVRAPGGVEPVAPDEAMSKAFGFSRLLKPGEQQDAQEFLGLFLDQLHEEIVQYAAGQGGRDRGSGLPPMMNGDAYTGGTGGGGGVPKSSVVTGMFYGMFRSEGKKGTYSSITLEPFHCLQLDLGLPQSSPRPGVSHGSETANGPRRGGAAWGGAGVEWTTGPKATGLEEALAAFFAGEVKAPRKLTLERAPQVLTLHLIQFEYDAKLGSTKKLGRRVRYPLELTIPQHGMSPSLVRSSPGPLRYRLFAVVLHHGRSLHGGHYTALVRDARGQWRHCDDQHVSPETEVHALNPKSGHPYLLLYTRL